MSNSCGKYCLLYIQRAVIVYLTNVFGITFEDDMKCTQMLNAN